MKIRRISTPDEPDINLIPLIDVLLVIVIFLVIATTFVKPGKLKVNLPGSQNAETQKTPETPIRIRVGQDGNFSIDNEVYLSENALRNGLSNRIKSQQQTKNSASQAEGLAAIIEADAAATHQSVVIVMDALAQLGVSKVSIATARNGSN